MDVNSEVLTKIFSRIFSQHKGHYAISLYQFRSILSSISTVSSQFEKNIAIITQKVITKRKTRKNVKELLQQAYYQLIPAFPLFTGFDLDFVNMKQTRVQHAITPWL